MSLWNSVSERQFSEAQLSLKEHVAQSTLCTFFSSGSLLFFCFDDYFQMFMFVTYFSCNVSLLCVNWFSDGSDSLPTRRLSSCQDFTKLLNVVVVEKAWTVAFFSEIIENVAVCGLHEWVTHTVL